MFLCVPPPRQHGQAPNQALLQPQHLCVGQTVSGAAQVADIPSHERGSRNARQEAQCAWERQLCKLRRDVWQHLTPLLILPPSLSASPLFFPPSPLSSPSPHPSFFFFFGLASACWFYLLDWHEKTLNCNQLFSSVSPIPPPFFLWQRMKWCYVRQSDFNFHKCNSGAGSENSSLCTVYGVIWWHFNAPEI